ncbi:unnamed protein product [Phaedon cochleariae]|uniref:Uncharacterized protein n=1 Tax=Phaedon cochleariae TaxID=80249 RepID=A0A9N9X3C8_PHACE|nr:unnamed protein product [Phaedon cochleariae]
MIRVCLFTFIFVAHRLSTIKTEECYPTVKRIYNSYSFNHTLVFIIGENPHFDVRGFPITRCLDQKQFRTEVISIHVLGLSRLYKGSMRNFPKLRTIYVASNLEEIDPQAFFNVPRLEEIIMRYSKLKTIQKEDSEDTKKIAVFLSICGSATFERAHSLALPTEVEDLTSKDVMEKLNAHFYPKKSEMVGRFRFHRREQGPDETISSYIDRLVCGVKDETLQRRLLDESCQTFGNAEKIALAHKAAVRNVLELIEPDTSYTNQWTRIEQNIIVFECKDLSPWDDDKSMVIAITRLSPSKMDCEPIDIKNNPSECKNLSPWDDDKSMVIAITRGYVVIGCLEPEEFDGTEIIEAKINLGILRLGKESIRNLPKLMKIQISARYLEKVEPKAFKNLPGLKELYITNTKLEDIQRELINNIKIAEEKSETWFRVNNLELNKNKTQHIIFTSNTQEANGNSVKLLGITLMMDDKLNWSTHTEQLYVFNIIPSITTLLLNGNKIDFIASGSFSNLEKLDTINLSDNSLMVWNAEWFENCKALRIMDFSNNKIPNIPRRAFAELPRLKNISFENNEITTIQTDSFRNLENLTSLNLAHNRLTIIDEKAFPNSIYIHTLRIHSNYLNYLPNQLLRKLSVREIFLDYNPWKCSCLDVLNYWMFFTNARPQMVPGCKSPFAPICAVSRRYTKTCRESVEEDLTLRYIGLLNSLPQPLGKRCARLD